MNPTRCLEHEESISQICMGSDCRNRLMCESCSKSQEHRFHGRHIKFNLKEAIQHQKTLYTEQCLERLNEMVDYLSKRLIMEIASIRRNIEKEIVVRSRM